MRKRDCQAVWELKLKVQKHGWCAYLLLAFGCDLPELILCEEEGLSAGCLGIET